MKFSMVQSQGSELTWEFFQTSTPTMPGVVVGNCVWNESRRKQRLHWEQLPDKEGEHSPSGEVQ